MLVHRARLIFLVHGNSLQQLESPALSVGLSTEDLNFAKPPGSAIKLQLN
jgi:hypothetical protein